MFTLRLRVGSVTSKAHLGSGEYRLGKRNMLRTLEVVDGVVEIHGLLNDRMPLHELGTANFLWLMPSLDSTIQFPHNFYLMHHFSSKKGGSVCMDFLCACQDWKV